LIYTSDDIGQDSDIAHINYLCGNRGWSFGGMLLEFFIKYIELENAESPGKFKCILLKAADKDNGKLVRFYESNGFRVLLTNSEMAFERYMVYDLTPGKTLNDEELESIIYSEQEYHFDSSW
jgi:hypothetical protein